MRERERERAGWKKRVTGIMESRVDEIGEPSKEEGREAKGDEALCFCSNSVKKTSPMEEEQEGALLPTSCPAWALVWPPFVVLVKEL